MSAEQTPQGRRFSHVYVPRGEPVRDDPRMRHRLAALISTFQDFENFGGVIERELGTHVPSSQFGYRDWKKFFTEAQLVDVLDLVTVGFRFLQTMHIKKEVNSPERWRNEVRRIFAEQNVHYRVDDHGGVHFSFDQQFDNSLASAIAALRGARYKNSLHLFNEAVDAMGKVPPDGKGAVRFTFAAVEGLFRLMFPDAAKLTAKESQRLAGVIQKKFEADVTARRAAQKLLNAFGDWIDAAHFYRHEPGSEEPAQPPLTLAVYMVSEGAAHLRWLAHVTDIAARAMVDAVEVCGIIAVIEASNDKKVISQINAAAAGRAAGHIQRSLFTRMHIVVARAYSPTRKGDLHVRHAFEMLRNKKIRNWFINSDKSEELLLRAEALWDASCGSDIYEPFIQYRHKQLAHLAELDPEVRGFACEPWRPRGLNW